MAELVGVTRKFLPAGWEAARPMLEPAIERSGGRYSVETVIAALWDRQLQLWLVVTDRPVGALVTEVVTYPAGLKAAVLLLAGAEEGRDAWLPLWPRLEAWAKAQGCDVAEIEGRPGWARVLKDWRPFAMKLERTIA